MLFNSIEFLIFLPIILILFWVFPKRLRWLVLLAASYCFYMWWNWKLVFLILFTTLISYLCGILVERFNNSKKIKNTVLSISLILCFGVLVFFKYFPFLADVYSDVVKVFGGQGIHGYFDIMLPVGISFYTFQTASYVIDCYKGTMKTEKHFGYFALFVTFFPQLVAGPIERPQDLLPQLHFDKRDMSIKKIDYSSALRIMLIGFFKKIAIADVIGIYVNNVYQNINDANGFMVLFASFLFAVQIFCDFSGYSDIAVGCAKLFGVDLTENFKNPYGAKSVKDFWNRWHISLSKWLRDYIYFPLGGSRVKKWRWVINVMVVFFISGLWHGANYTFIVWGLLHGAFQIVGVLTLKYRNKALSKIKIKPEGRFVSIARVILTFLIVDFCWIFFRANNIGDASLAITKIFTDWKFNLDFFKESFASLGINIKAFVYILICILSLPLIEKLKYIQTNDSKIFNISSVRYASYFILSLFVIGAWIYLQASEVGSSFIYFQF